MRFHPYGDLAFSRYSFPRELLIIISVCSPAGGVIAPESREAMRLSISFRAVEAPSDRCRFLREPRRLTFSNGLFIPTV